MCVSFLLLPLLLQFLISKNTHMLLLVLLLLLLLLLLRQPMILASAGVLLLFLQTLTPPTIPLSPLKMTLLSHHLPCCREFGQCLRLLYYHVCTRCCCACSDG